MAVTLLTDTMLSAIVIGIASISLYYLVIFPLLISPLSKIPGSRLAALSSANLDVRFARDTAIPSIHRLIQEYGPIVRIGPKEVAVNDPEHLSTIYGVRSFFPKPPAIALFANYGVHNAFSSVERDDHRERRRRVGKIYHMGTLLNNAPLAQYLANRISVFRDRIASAPDGRLDVYHLSTQFALDNVSFTVYGRGFDVLRGQRENINRYLRDTGVAGVSMLRFHKWIGALSFWPFETLLPQYIKDSISSSMAFSDINMEEVKYASQQGLDPGVAAVASIQSHNGPSELESVASECSDHVMAGADTTGAAITYLFYNLALPESARYQTRLRKELSSLDRDATIKDICELTFLDHCVSETLRLHAPGPGSLQHRATPAGVDTPITVQGRTYILPAGTIVGVYAYSLHRESRIFGPDVEAWNPERWEEPDDAVLQKMRQAWIPFGTGARVCVGKHLAVIEVKALVASIIRDYSVQLPADVNRSDIEPILAGFIRPRSESCELVFRRLEP